MNADLVIDSLADAVYVTDKARRIVMWNRAAEAITGWRREEILGQSCYDDILAHESPEGQRLCGTDTCPLHLAITHNQPSVVPRIIFARTKGGVRFPVEVSVAPLHDGAGNVIGGVESFRDLSPVLADLRRASAIQQQSLSARLPPDPRLGVASRSRPQGYVSGDFCRVEALDQDRYALMVGDVMGHGLASALYTIHVRSAWEEARAELGCPEVFMTRLNRTLAVLTAGNEYFATAFYGVLDADSGELRYVNAGHPPPLLFAADGCSRLDGTGWALGLTDVNDFRPGAVTLAVGDKLLVYTDGAVEARNGEGNALGIDGLAEMVASGGVNVCEAGLSRIEEELLELSAQPGLADDLALLGIEYRGADHG